MDMTTEINELSEQLLQHRKIFPLGELWVKTCHMPQFLHIKIVKNGMSNGRIISVLEEERAQPL